MSRFSQFVVEQPKKTQGFGRLIKPDEKHEYLLCLQELALLTNDENVDFIFGKCKVLESTNTDNPVDSLRAIYIYSTQKFEQYKKMTNRLCAALNGGYLPNDDSEQAAIISQFIALDDEPTNKSAGTLFRYEMLGRETKKSKEARAAAKEAGEELPAPDVYALKSYHAATDSDYIRHEEAVEGMAS